MNKSTNIKLLNGTSSSSPGVLLSRQTISTKSSLLSETNFIILNNLIKLMDAIQNGLVTYISYLSGDLTKLPKIINSKIIQSLSTTFFQLKDPTLVSTVYEKYRVFATSIIPAFQNISNQVSKCQITQNKLETALEKISILDNITLLQQYINGLKKSIEFIPTQNLTVPKATVKEPYNTYIKLFGLPEGMIWESDKIAFVRESLNMNIDDNE
jgi:hypothetical protein